MNEDDAKILSHLNTFSPYALQALAAARLKAGQRGASAIEVGDLLAGLILADQGSWANLLPEFQGVDTQVDVPSRIPFFSTEAASNLLSGIEALLARSEPIGHTIEVPLSPEVQLAFDEAENIRRTFLNKQIEPLHLLAGTLMHETNECVKVLLRGGMTKQALIQKLAG